MLNQKQGSALVAVMYGLTVSVGLLNAPSVHARAEQTCAGDPFDPVAYVNRYPDLKAAQDAGQLGDPCDHYANNGKAESRFGGADGGDAGSITQADTGNGGDSTVNSGGDQNREPASSGEVAGGESGGEHSEGPESPEGHYATAANELKKQKEEGREGDFELFTKSVNIGNYGLGVGLFGIYMGKVSNPMKAESVDDVKAETGLGVDFKAMVIDPNQWFSIAGLRASVSNDEGEKFGAVKAKLNYRLFGTDVDFGERDTLDGGVSFETVGTPVKRPLVHIIFPIAGIVDLNIEAGAALSKDMKLTVAMTHDGSPLDAIKDLRGANFKVRTAFGPRLAVGAYAEVSLSLAVIRAGLGGEVTLIAVEEKLFGDYVAESNELQFGVAHRMNTLAGRIYGFVDGWFLGWNRIADFTIVEFPGASTGKDIIFGKYGFDDGHWNWCDSGCDSAQSRIDSMGFAFNTPARAPAGGGGGGGGGGGCGAEDPNCKGGGNQYEVTE